MEDEKCMFSPIEFCSNSLYIKWDPGSVLFWVFSFYDEQEQIYNKKMKIKSTKL